MFGVFKYERRRMPGVLTRRASGLPQARVMMCLAHRPSIKRRKAHARTTKTVKAATNNFGYFHRLPHTEQVASVEMTRAERQEQRRLLDQMDINTEA